MKPFSSKEALGLAVLALMCVAALSVGYFSRSGSVGAISGEASGRMDVLPPAEAVMAPESAVSACDSISVSGQHESRRSGGSKESSAKRKRGSRNKEKKLPVSAPTRRDPFADDVTSR